MYRLDSEPLQYLHSTVFPLAMLSFHFWHRHHIYYNYVNKSVFLKNSYFSLRYPETRFQSFLIYPYEVIFDILYMCKGELYFTSKPKWLVHMCCFEGAGGREWSTRDVLSPVHRGSSARPAAQAKEDPTARQALWFTCPASDWAPNSGDPQLNSQTVSQGDTSYILIILTATEEKSLPCQQRSFCPEMWALKAAEITDHQQRIHIISWNLFLLLRTEYDTTLPPMKFRFSLSVRKYKILF